MALLIILLLAGASSEAGGALRIETQPGVEVLWDGMSVGNADERGVLEIEDIPAGSFVVTLRKRGFREREVTVEIAGRDSLLAMTLEPIPPPPQRAPPARPAATRVPIEANAKRQTAGTTTSREGRAAVHPTAAAEILAVDADADGGDDAAANGAVHTPVDAAADRARHPDATTEAGSLAPSGRGWGLVTTLAALTAAAGIVLGYRRRRARVEPSMEPPPQHASPPLRAVPAAEPADILAPKEKVIPGSTSFLEELRRHERELEPPRGRRDEGRNVIDVEFQRLEREEEDDPP